MLKTKATTKNSARAATPPPPLENVTNDAAVTIAEAQLDVGQCFAQGDLLFVRLPALPASARPRADRQLADGDTQGSRHVCVVGDVFDADAEEVRTMIRRANPRADVGPQYVGPVVRSRLGLLTVEHPEHGDHQYVGDLVLAVVFQRSVDAEEREARVRD